MDRALVEQARRGDREAFAVLVHQVSDTLYFNNYFWLVDPDGSGALPVNLSGDDLSDLNVGFGLIGHWVDDAP